MQLSSVSYGLSSAIDTQRLKAMRNLALRDCFSRLEENRHRLQTVARIRGREYIDDAAASSVNATWYSLECTKGGLIWIAEAPLADTDYSRLVPTALRKVRMLLIINNHPLTTSPLAALGGIIPIIETCSSMAEALQKAYRYEADDVKVIYSPACSGSQTPEERGQAFCHEVNEL